MRVRTFLSDTGFFLLGILAIAVPTHIIHGGLIERVARLDANWTTTAYCLAHNGRLRFTVVDKGQRFEMHDAVCEVLEQGRDWP